MFEFMPLGAVIEDKSLQHKVFCVHGGMKITLGDISN